MLGAAKEKRVQFGVVTFVGCCCRCVLRQDNCWCTGVVSRIGSTVPGVLFLVNFMWMQLLVSSVNLSIGFVDVVTGGAVITLWAGSSPSEMGVASTLWWYWACVSVEIFQGLLPSILVAWIWHQDSCYGLNSSVHHILHLHVYQGWIRVIKNVVAKDQTILRIWVRLFWELTNVTLYSYSITSRCTIHLCLVLPTTLYLQGFHRWLLLTMLMP